MAQLTQNEWQNGEFECCNDVGNCCFGYCCAPCMICNNATGLDENGCLYCLLACCCPVLAICLLRQKARERYGIEGDAATDLLCSCCCGVCVNCQTAAEIKARSNAPM